MEKFLVIIVGGGPAGISAAYHLCRENEKADGVLLLEKRGPREWEQYHRMCAEGMGAESFARMGGGADLVLNRIHRVRELWPGGIELGAAGEGIIVDRRGLLRRLRDQATKQGCLLGEEEVVCLDRAEGGYAIKTGSGRSYHCRYLIGADGSGSLVRHSLFPAEPPCIMPVVQYVVPKGGPRDELCLEYGERYRGKYRWSFPNGDRYKTGFPVGSSAEPSGALERHARAIPIGPLPRYALQDACIVGDAAAQANPVTFAGMRMGWEAGRMAAEAIRAGDLLRYDREWQASPYHDPCYWEWFQALRQMSDGEMERLLRPLQQGYSMNSITEAIVEDPRFSLFYRAHVRKLTWGW